MRLYVGNLPKQITDPQLHDLAAAFGKPQSANIARMLVGGASKGFGFIEYATAEEAKAAVAGLNGKSVQGQALEVHEAKTMNAGNFVPTVRQKR